MPIILRTFYILLIFGFLIALSCGEPDIINRVYPSPSPIIKNELSANNPPLALSFSSPRSIPIVGQIPIIINKYTKNLKTEYDKRENITIRIRIINCDKRNRIEKAYLQEEIPEGFIVVSPVVNSGTNPRIITEEGIQSLLWFFDEGLPYRKHVEYTLQGTKMGLHNLVSTVVSTSVLDNIGVTHNIVSVSEDLTLNIKNDPPGDIDYYQENPIYVRHKNKLSINASFRDRENDTINCNLFFNNTLKSIKPYKSFQDNRTGKTFFTWDLSNYTDDDQIFYLTANDGESYKTFGPFELKTYNYIEFEKHNFAGENVFPFIFSNIGPLLLGLAALFTLIERKKVFANVKSVINHNRRILIKNYDCALEADKWNKIGLKLYHFHKFDESISAFNNAIEIYPTLPVFWCNKGKALFDKNSYKESIECFSKAIEIDPNFAEANYFKGLAMTKLDSNSAVAQAFIDKAKKIQDEKSVLH
jgi:tetratricopeptide (TPR) repeat protein